MAMNKNFHINFSPLYVMWFVFLGIFISSTLSFSNYFESTSLKEKKIITFISLNLIYIWLHIGFLKFVTKNKGIKKAFGSLFMFYLDTLLMLIALSFGSLSVTIKHLITELLIFFGNFFIISLQLELSPIRSIFL